LSLPEWKAPRLNAPNVSLPRLARPQLTGLTWIVAAVILVLVIVPLAYIVFPPHKTVASRRLTPTVTTTHQQVKATASATPLPAGSPQAVAAAAVSAKTGLKYSNACSGTAGCLSITGQTIGQNAAAVVFSTAKTGGQECVGYVAQQGGAWQPVSTACGAPGTVSPLVGQNATVHVGASCANARSSPGLQGGRLVCLYNGSPVHVDGGPSLADGLLWWHTNRGWIAQSFLGA
jgi:hypothetical protein